MASRPARKRKARDTSYREDDFEYSEDAMAVDGFDDDDDDDDDVYSAAPARKRARGPAGAAAAAAGTDSLVTRITLARGAAADPDELDDREGSPAAGGAQQHDKFGAVDSRGTLKVKADYQVRPLWVAENGRIFLESFSPIYKQARDFLVAISEPVVCPLFFFFLVCKL